MSYLEVFVGSLLPLLGHGVRSLAGEHPDGGKEDEANADADGSVEGDLLALTWGRESARAVGSEGNPVCCRSRRVLWSVD